MPMEGRWWGAALIAVWAGVAPLGAQTTGTQASGGAVPAVQPTPAPPAADQPAAPVGARAASAPKKEEPKLAPASAGKDGFLIQSETGDFKLRVSGYAQGDGRFYLKDDARALTDSFLLRRVRPIVQGTVSKYFDFYINPDFGDGKVLLYDAYVDVRYSPHFKMRVGKMKPPFGLERLQSGASLMFVERALPTGLAPNRDVGIQLHGDLAGAVVSYAVGLFDGGPDGGNIDGDTNDSKDVVGRLLVRPFKGSSSKALNGLGLAVAGSTGRQKGALPSFKSGGQQTFFTYDSKTAADGERVRWSPQAYWYAGPVGVLGEYVRSRQNVRKDATSGKIGNRAWQVAGSVVLTGEAASAGGVKPKKPFDPAKGTWGALELAARVNVLDVDDQAFELKLADPTVAASRARAWALGVNWYLSPNFKYVLNYERTTFLGGAKTGARPTENVLILRAQISY